MILSTTTGKFHHFNILLLNFWFLGWSSSGIEVHVPGSLYSILINIQIIHTCFYPSLYASHFLATTNALHVLLLLLLTMICVTNLFTSYNVHQQDPIENKPQILDQIHILIVFTCSLILCRYVFQSQMLIHQFYEQLYYKQPISSPSVFYKGFVIKS